MPAGPEFLARLDGKEWQGSPVVSNVGHAEIAAVFFADDRKQRQALAVYL